MGRAKESVKTASRCWESAAAAINGDKTRYLLLKAPTPGPFCELLFLAGEARALARSRANLILFSLAAGFHILSLIK
jgi:hypothetical protein